MEPLRGHVRDSVIPETPAKCPISADPPIRLYLVDSRVDAPDPLFCRSLIPALVRSGFDRADSGGSGECPYLLRVFGGVRICSDLFRVVRDAPAALTARVDNGVSGWWAGVGARSGPLTPHLASPWKETIAKWQIRRIRADADQIEPDRRSAEIGHFAIVPGRGEGGWGGYDGFVKCEQAARASASAAPGLRHCGPSRRLRRRW